MSHQVNFFLLPGDLAAIEEHLRRLDDWRILHSRSPTAQPRILDTMSFEEHGEPWLFLYLVRTDDLGDVVTEHVPAQGYWTVQVLESPVVELTRCFFDGKILRRGRMYYVDGFYRSDKQWQDKPEAFTRWAKLILAHTKKLLRRSDAEYIGPDAQAWLASSPKSSDSLASSEGQLVE